MHNVIRIYRNFSQSQWSCDSKKQNWNIIPTKVFNKMHALPRLLKPCNVTWFACRIPTLKPRNIASNYVSSRYSCVRVWTSGLIWFVTEHFPSYLCVSAGEKIRHWNRQRKRGPTGNSIRSEIMWIRGDSRVEPRLTATSVVQSPR